VETGPAKKVAVNEIRMSSPMSSQRDLTMYPALKRIISSLFYGLAEQPERARDLDNALTNEQPGYSYARYDIHPDF